jgi:Reverse transcriptase (RNA-dependent DNA polymerase)
MKLIADKYRSLKPTIDYLTDEVVMAQAWKKTHEYMRHHNWYADTLALDVSALGLESNVRSWAEDIKNDDPTPYPLILIPAAKSDNWVVDKDHGWLPRSILNKDENRKAKPPLRPLAHLRVRDQTRASAIMLCMADAVESAQGDCSETDFLKAQQKYVFSYGNRLYCDWQENKAWFRWGNSSIYRKFFIDYQNFLKRPVSIGRIVANNQHDIDHVFIVNLDLTKFYDHVNRPKLIDRLKKLAGFYEQPDLCSEFWKKAEKIIDWQWDSISVNTARRLGLEIGQGLPQGLVASGFLANAYLVEFDKKIGSHIGKSLSDSSPIVLHDYCRYVDDVRLVISIDDDAAIDNLSEIINSWFSKHLSKYAGENLTLNADKTKVTLLSDLDNMGSLSGRVAQLQSDLSGPADRDLLESSLSVLEGLLTNQPTDLPEIVLATKDQSLVRLAKFDHDVRPDTLKRFAANRLETIMRHKRKVYIQDNDVNDTYHEQSTLDNECELLAKKLVWAWMQDPSLALVLRKAIEIYPSPVIAEPVFEAIFYRCSFINKSDNNKISTGDEISEATADFLLADLFRCCVDFHGFFQRIDCPESADPDGLLALACRYAQKAVSNEKLPKFIEWQALLLLAVMQKPVLFQNEDQSIQHTLHAILVGKPISIKRQNLALYEVAAQITGNADMVVALLFDQIEGLDDQFIKDLLDEFAKRGGDFWLSIWKKLKKSQIKKSFIQEFLWAAPVLGSGLRPVQQRLLKLATSQENGFIHEAALIKLALDC